MSKNILHPAPASALAKTLRNFCKRKIKALGDIPTLEDMQSDGADIDEIASNQHDEGYMLALQEIITQLEGK